jgi:hypothetical protein
MASCLLVSAFLRPELPLSATDYVADLFLGMPIAASDALMWLLIALAGVGLMALRPGACFLVYIAFGYSLVPWGPELLVFPVTPFVKALLGAHFMASGVAPHLLNGLFVLAVIGVHVTLARTTRVHVMSPACYAILSGIAASAGVLAAALTAAVIADAVPRSIRPVLNRLTRAIADSDNPFTIMAYVALFAVPLAVWGIPSFVVACVRLGRARRTRSQLHKGSEDAVGGESEGTTPSAGAAAVSTIRFRRATLLVGAVVMGLLVAISVSTWRNTTDANRYQQRFQSMASWADRIVVRDGGFNCCGPVDHQGILFEVTDATEIAELRKHIELMPGTPGGGCMCCGYPGIDWYRGSQRLALTSLQHGRALRWKGLPGDASLTEESAKALRDWLKRHGISEGRLR